MDHTKSTIKINFVDFWKHLDKTDNYFFSLLSKKYNVEIANSPDILIYSCYGEDHLKYNCIKVFYNGENQRINWNACDFAFGMDLIENNTRYYRLPNWVLYDDPLKLTYPRPNSADILAEKTRFCNMVISNGRAKKRIAFFHKLNKYKKVDSGGRYLNNIGEAVSNKIEFVRKYKFTIAFENSSYPGYTTEKLFEPMLVNSLPVYWGNPEVQLDFNTKSFLNYHDYKNDEALIEKLIELDNDDDLYLKMLSEPWYNNNRMPEFLKEENILNQLDLIIRSIGEIKPVAQTLNRYKYSFFRYKNRLINRMNTIIPAKETFR